MQNLNNWFLICCTIKQGTNRKMEWEEIRDFSQNNYSWLLFTPCSGQFGNCLHIFGILLRKLGDFCQRYIWIYAIFTLTSLSNTILFGSSDTIFWQMTVFPYILPIMTSSRKSVFLFFFIIKFVLHFSSIKFQLLIASFVTDFLPHWSNSANAWGS